MLKTSPLDTSKQFAVPVPLPASIAAVTGRTAGESKIGAWLS
jgi:hypothetical protein